MNRQEHIEMLETIGCDGWTVTTEAYESLKWAIEEVNQQKEGKWIIWDISSHDWTYKCSECERIEKRASTYCPNCGAHMKNIVNDTQVDKKEIK